MPYGYSDPDWNAAEKQAKAILQKVARAKDTIAYSELTATITAISFDPDEYAFHAFLGEISEEEDDAGRGLMTVMVVHKGGDMMPGPGFFELAQSRGRNISNRLACWTNELNAVYAAWAAE